MTTADFSINTMVKSTLTGQIGIVFSYTTHPGLETLYLIKFENGSSDLCPHTTLEPVHSAPEIQ